MKKKLLLSTIALMLTMALVGGATFALFSSQATNGPNLFTAGTLDIGVPNDDPNVGTMNFTNAAPGDSYDYSITVNNKGTLPFLYKISAKRHVESGATYPSEEIDLFDVLTVQVNDGQAIPLKSLKDYAVNTNMAPGSSEICKLTIGLPLETDNQYQGLSACIDFVFDAQQVSNMSNLSNAGFESGNLNGWTVVNQADSVAVTGADQYTSPIWGNYMARLGTPGYTGQNPGSNAIAQTFNVVSPQLTFAYNIFTYDYYPFDNFNYQVKVVQGNTVLASYNTAAFGGSGKLATTGWQTVSLDLSAYVGQDVKVYVSAGGTSDSSYNTWAYFDTL
jgi:predicted ribosomally synthesized peptide with SipW-like signal peptide